MGSDHAGLALKKTVKAELSRRGHRVEDMGTYSASPCDYPVYAARVARAVAGRRAGRGVLMCGTGIGMGIAANKVRGIRAAVAWDAASARLAAAHNDANVLCLSGNLLTRRRALGALQAWITTPFEGGRHARRVREIARLEKAGGSPGPGGRAHRAAPARKNDVRR